MGSYWGALLHCVRLRSCFFGDQSEGVFGMVAETTLHLSA